MLSSSYILLYIQPPHSLPLPFSTKFLVFIPLYRSEFLEMKWPNMALSITLQLLQHRPVGWNVDSTSVYGVQQMCGRVKISFPCVTAWGPWKSYFSTLCHPCNSTITATQPPNPPNGSQWGTTATSCSRYILPYPNRKIYRSVYWKDTNKVKCLCSYRESLVIN